MITRAQILKLIPTANGKTLQNFPVVVNQNIIKTIHAALPQAIEVTKPIAYLFAGDSVESTARNIWNFLKYQIRYVKDDINQNIKLPNRFISDGTGDCKSYSLFAASIFTNLGIKNALRYASYDKVNPTPQHVYSVALTGADKNCTVIITDGVWNRFNEQKKYTFKKDFMPINTLTGFDDTEEIGKFGDKAKAAVKKVQTAVKNTGVVKAAAKAQTAVKNTGVVKAAAKVQNNAKGTALVKAAVKAQSGVKVLARKGADVLKNLPKGAKVVVNAPARAAFRTLVAVNFHGFANKLAAAGDKSFELWKKLGGVREDLEKSIRNGQSRRALLGIGCTECQLRTDNGVGSVTLAKVGTFLAVATPVIVAFFGILKYVVQAKAVKNANAKVDENGNIIPDPGQTQNNDNGSTNNTGGGYDGGGGYNSGNGGSNTNGQIDPTSNTNGEVTETKEGPGTGTLVLAAIAAKLLFF